jgi:predicted ATPase
MGTISGQCDLTIDEYMKPEGLVIIEWTDPPVDAYDRLPDWMRGLGLVDVTLSLTAAHIANLPPLDLSVDPLPYLRHQIGPRIPVFVATGGPVAGKSETLKKLAQDPSLLVVPEAATILIKQLGIDPYGPEGHSERFQMALRRVQMTFETLACSQARAMGKKAVVVDRGTLDSCAYIPGGRNGFNQYFGFDAMNEEQRYQAVVQLAVPNETIYNKYRGDNTARPADETHDKALNISKALQQAWGKHPRYLYVDDTDWDTKQRRAIEFITSQLP